MGFHISKLGDKVVVPKLRILTLQLVRGRVHRRGGEIGRKAIRLLLFHEIRDDCQGNLKEGHSRCSCQIVDFDRAAR